LAKRQRQRRCIKEGKKEDGRKDIMTGKEGGEDIKEGRKEGRREGRISRKEGGKGTKEGRTEGY
jgi:hypothetical protein